MTRERVRQSHMHALSDPCPTCDGLGRVLSKDTMMTKIERWFKRARANGEHNAFHLSISPHLAETMTDNGSNRVARMMKIHKFKINVVRDTTIPIQEYKVFDAVTNDDITEKYLV